ncbi:uncharacterized protein LOC142612157 [Castanea sativa]|uniref:uncharacterized protein LOC142612157 n=1 Tax=Castanea sativa TaxID=21020 RepID=UPI003F64BF4A
MEKLVFALVTVSRKLRPYFQAHVINVLTNHPLKKAMNKLEAAGRLIQWVVKLSEFDVRYQPRSVVKAQALANFIAEFTPNQDELDKEERAQRMTVRTPTRETPFKLAYGSEAVISAEVHMANHKVMQYQREENEEQLRLNLDLIDEVRMDAEQRTARYKNLMARQYDTMVKPMRFNIRDLIAKRVSLAAKNPAHGKLGPN